MRKVKLDTKSEKSAEALFDNEIPDRNEALGFAGSANILELEKEKGFTGEHKSLINLLKQVFIFFREHFSYFL